MFGSRNGNLDGAIHGGGIVVDHLDRESAGRARLPFRAPSRGAVTSRTRTSHWRVRPRSHEHLCRRNSSSKQASRTGRCAYSDAKARARTQGTTDDAPCRARTQEPTLPLQSDSSCAESTSLRGIVISHALPCPTDHLDGGGVAPLAREVWREIQ